MDTVVFLENRIGCGNKENLATEVMNSETNNTKQSTPSLCSNSNSQSMMSPGELCNKKEDYNGNPGCGCGSEEITLSIQSNHDRNAEGTIFTADGSDTSSCLGKVSNAGCPTERVDSVLSQSKSLLDCERIILHQNCLKICESGCTYEQNSPIKCENKQTLMGGCATVSPVQDSNWSSMTCHKEGSQHYDELPMGYVVDAPRDPIKQMGEIVDINLNPVQCGSVVVDFNCSTYGQNSKIYDASIAASALVRSNVHKAEIGSKSGSNVAECFLVENHKVSGSGKLGTSKLNDNDLLISAILKKRTFISTNKGSKAKHLSKWKRQKTSCKLPLPKFTISQRRTVLSWLIHSGIVSLGQVIQYRKRKTDIVMKEGLVTSDGILCKCCNMVISMNEFKRHAGFRLNGPCLNLILESGKPFVLCQLEAWSAEYKARKDAIRSARPDEMDEYDDICGHCGREDGELICCDNSPSTFHKECLYLQEIPDGNWYCRRCTCQICGHVVNNKEASKPPGTLKCCQCDDQYHEACREETGEKVDMASDTWFCCKACQEVYFGLQARVGSLNLLPDGCQWTLLKAIEGDQRVHSTKQLLALKAECNSKLAVASTILEECFDPMVDPRTGVDVISQVVYNWGSEFPRLNYNGFYTVVLEKEDILIAVASIRIHGVRVAEMPLIATCENFRRQRMCTRLLDAIESMLKSLKVEKLVISAIPELVRTWKECFGFTTLEASEKRSLSNINLMVFPDTEYLKKHLFENKQFDSNPGSHNSSTVRADDPTATGDCVKGLSLQSEQCSDQRSPIQEATKVEKT